MRSILIRNGTWLLVYDDNNINFDFHLNEKGKKDSKMKKRHYFLEYYFLSICKSLKWRTEATIHENDEYDNETK